jgi:dTDP-glucose 4,6-dehydratase
MKLLITGASTSLGSQVFSWFKQYYPEMQVVTLEDLSDVRAVNHFFEVEHIDAVIHLAAASQHVAAGTKTLLDAANSCWQGNHLIKRFFHVSGDSVAANKALLRKYKDMTLVVSSCSDSFASSAFPVEYIALADQNVKNNKAVPVYANGQKVPEWFWASGQACAIDVLFHQGEAGVIYNIGGMNAWKSADADVKTNVPAYAYVSAPAMVKSYQSFMVKIKRIFSNLVADLNV